MRCWATWGRPAGGPNTAPKCRPTLDPATPPALPPDPPQILKASVRDPIDVRAYAPPAGLPAANLLDGEIAYVTDKVTPGDAR